MVYYSRTVEVVWRKEFLCAYAGLSIMRIRSGRRQVHIPEKRPLAGFPLSPSIVSMLCNFRVPACMQGRYDVVYLFWAYNTGVKASSHMVTPHKLHAAKRGHGIQPCRLGLPVVTPDTERQLNPTLISQCIHHTYCTVLPLPCSP
jgi:hypothetical protein